MNNNIKDKILISPDTYIIDRNLERALKRNKIDIKSYKPFYFVVVRVLNRDKKILAYTYLEYSAEYLMSFIEYIKMRWSNNNNTALMLGSFMVFSDDEVIVKKSSIYYCQPEKLTTLYNSIRRGDRIALHKFINNLIFCGTRDVLAIIVDLLFKRDITSFTKIILLQYFTDLGYSKQDIQQNMNTVDSCINKQTRFNFMKYSTFIVRDLKEFRNLISEKGYIISQGPQSTRGRLNSRHHFLTLLDVDFRGSLLEHHNHHEHLNPKSEFPNLHRSNFYFDNVHNFYYDNTHET